MQRVVEYLMHDWKPSHAYDRKFVVHFEILISSLGLPVSIIHPVSLRFGTGVSPPSVDGDPIIDALRNVLGVETGTKS